MLIFNIIEHDVEYFTKIGNDNKHSNNNNLGVVFWFINKLNNDLFSRFSTLILDQLPLESWKSEVSFK